MSETAEPTLRFINKKIGCQWLIVGRKGKSKIHVPVEFPIRRKMPKSYAEAKRRRRDIGDSIDSAPESSSIYAQLVAEHYILLWAIREAERA